MSLCGVSTRLIPLRQSRGGGVSASLTCLCFEISLSCSRPAASTPPAAPYHAAVQQPVTAITTCGLRSSDTAHKQQRRGHPTRLPTPAAHLAPLPLAIRREMFSARELGRRKAFSGQVSACRWQDADSQFRAWQRCLVLLPLPPTHGAPRGAQRSCPCPRRARAAHPAELGTATICGVHREQAGQL